jgi:hypothetical protein
MPRKYTIKFIQYFSGEDIKVRTIILIAESPYQQLIYYVHLNEGYTSWGVWPPPSSSDIKNKWSCMSTAPVCLRGIKRDDCTSLTSL